MLRFKLQLILYFFLTAVPQANSNAQIGELDSLQRQLVITHNDDEKILLLEQIFSVVQSSNALMAVEIAYQMKEVSLKRFGRNSKQYISALNFLGIGYMYLEHMDSSLHYFQQMLDVSSDMKDSANISKCYNNIGALHGNMDNYPAAIYYINKSAEIDELRGDQEGALISYLNIGSVYLVIGSRDSARYFLTKSLELAIKTENTEAMTAGYLSLGVFETDFGNTVVAEQHLKKALEFAEESNDKDALSKIYHNLARLSSINERYGDAVMHESRALFIAKESNSIKNMVTAHLGLAVAYENIGQYKSALENYKAHTILRDSLDNIENKEIVFEMQQKYQTDQALKENEILSQKNKIQDLEIAKNAEQIANSRIIIISSVVGLILLIVLAITLYNRNVLKQRANQKLQEAYAVIQEKNIDIMASIDYASKIQQALLPSSDEPNLFDDSFFLLKPKDIVSGDFVWHNQQEEYKFFAVVDCTGHGVPGAFMSMIGNTFLHQIIIERGFRDPGKILDELREKIITALNQKKGSLQRRDGMDMALCVLDTRNNTLYYAGANNPLFLIQNNILVEISSDKQPVGFFEGLEKPFTSHKIDVKSGDCIYIFSDGYVDQFGGPKGKKFKYRQLKELLFDIHLHPMQKQKIILIDKFVDWKGDLEQVDDVCMLGVRI